MSAGLAANSTVSLVALMAAGGGLSILPDITAAPEIAAGRLVRVLDEWALPEGGVYAVYPPGRHVTAKARAFMTFFDAWLQRES